MIKEVKKDVNEMTVEEKLSALYKLQTLMSEIDKIKSLRGELPLEVNLSCDCLGLMPCAVLAQTTLTAAFP